MSTHEFNIQIEVSSKKERSEVEACIAKALEHSTAGEAMIDALCAMKVQFDRWDIQNKDNTPIERELERLQKMCEELSERMEEEGNHDAAFYHKVLGQQIEQAVRYGKGR